MNITSSELTLDLIQTKHLPFDSLILAKAFIDHVKPILTWDKVTLLRDSTRDNLIFLIYKTEELQSAFRVNLNKNEFLEFVEYILGPRKSLEVRSIPDKQITHQEVINLKLLQDLWANYQFTSVILKNKTEKSQFITTFYSNEIKTGRGNPFTSKTIHQVMLDSHGRCMFTGCGENLNIDKLTGRKGNYAYNAHNIASSDNGERGLPYLSEALSNKAENVLLLCDKHHRLIDKVAAAEYDALTLNKMREMHKINSEKLLDALAFEPIQVYSILWPVHGNVSSTPDLKEISTSLYPLNYRINGALIPQCSIPHPDLFDQAFIQCIETEANIILRQTQHHNHKAAIFAFGPMPALIGLGALLGNKGEFIPMFKSRDTQKWEWPSTAMIDPINEVTGLDNLEKQSEIVLCIHATAIAEPLQQTARAIAEEKNIQIIEITNLEQYRGGQSIPHPKNVKILTTQIQKLLIKLKSDYGIALVHLLVIAPNAACVAIGQGIDKNHPDVIVYDFKGDGIQPVLRINSTEQGNKLIPV